MLRFTPCADAPFLKAGITVDGLYFTKAPGAKYLSIYARYKNNADWVPLHIGLPAIPTLQQVRDTDRNISVHTGSFDDAHFYLRSAEGNNMTAAYYTNAAGAAIQAGNTEAYQSLNLQPEGGLLTYNGKEIATQEWVDTAALVIKADLVTDFNTVITTGIYNIPDNLTSIAHYPHIGNNNNGASSGMLIVYKTPSILIQYFYPNNEANSVNRCGGFWYRRGLTDPWEYKNGVLEISLKTSGTAVQADALLIQGEYLITASNVTQYINAGFPDSGASTGGIPFMLTIRKKFGTTSWNFHITQELVSMQESALNLTRKWIRSKFNWRGDNAHAWDPWNEIGLLRDVYTKKQLNTPGAGGHVHWDNIDNKPTIVNTETDPVFSGARPNLVEASGYITDINTVVKSGISYTDPATANTFTGNAYNTTFTFIGASNTNDAWVNQIVAPTFNGADLFYRQKTNAGAWTAPKKFAFQDWVLAQAYLNSNIYTANGAIGSNRTVTVGSNTLQFVGSANAIGMNSSNIFIGANSGATVSNSIALRYGGGAFACIRTDNLGTSATLNQMPNNSGTFALSVNGIAANAQGDVVLPAIVSGPYSPATVSAASSNINTINYYGFKYMRIGNIVSVTGYIQYTAVSAGIVQIGITIPVPSNFSSNTNLTGANSCFNPDIIVAGTFADINNDCMFIQTDKNITGITISLSIHCQYEVL